MHTVTPEEEKINTFTRATYSVSVQRFACGAPTKSHDSHLTTFPSDSCGQEGETMVKHTFLAIKGIVFFAA